MLSSLVKSVPRRWKFDVRYKFAQRGIKAGSFVQTLGSDVRQTLANLQKNKVDVSSTMVTLNQMAENEPLLMARYLPEFVESCVKNSQIEQAMELYNEMTSRSICLDVRSLELLAESLTKNSRIDDLKRVLLSTPLFSERLLVVAAEPLIMVGQMNWFVSITFKQFLLKMPPPSSVSRVIRAILKSRARRHMSQTLTSESEARALKKLFAFLEKYHENVLDQGAATGAPMWSVLHSIDGRDAGAAGATTAEIAATSEAAAYALSSSASQDTNRKSRIDSLTYLPSSFAARQLYEMERYVMKLDHTADHMQISPEEAFFLRITPKFEPTTFPYVTEDRDVDFDSMSTLDSIILTNTSKDNKDSHGDPTGTEGMERGVGMAGMEIRDLTQQLALSRPNDFLLMSGSLFTLAYSYEMRQLKQKWSAARLMRGILGIVDGSRGELELAHDQYSQIEEDLLDAEHSMDGHNHHDDTDSGREEEEEDYDNDVDEMGEMDVEGSFTPSGTHSLPSRSSLRDAEVYSAGPMDNIKRSTDIGCPSKDTDTDSQHKVLPNECDPLQTDDAPTQDITGMTSMPTGDTALSDNDCADLTARDNSHTLGEMGMASTHDKVLVTLELEDGEVDLDSMLEAVDASNFFSSEEETDFGYLLEQDEEDNEYGVSTFEINPSLALLEWDPLTGRLGLHGKDAPQELDRLQQDMISLGLNDLSLNKRQSRAWETQEEASKTPLDAPSSPSPLSQDWSYTRCDLTHPSNINIVTNNGQGLVFAEDLFAARDVKTAAAAVGVMEPLFPQSEYFQDLDREASNDEPLGER